jgi:Mn-dependent DtxR family transcriptional regulator
MSKMQDDINPNLGATLSHVMSYKTRDQLEKFINAGGTQDDLDAIGKLLERERIQG